MREELRERLLAVTSRNPSGQMVQVFPEVHKAEELYNCSREEQPWLPDLILVPMPGLAVVRKIRGAAAVRWLSRRRIEGTHRLEGMLAVNGPARAAGHRRSTPTSPTSRPRCWRGWACRCRWTWRAGC